MKYLLIRFHLFVFMYFDEKQIKFNCVVDIELGLHFGYEV